MKRLVILALSAAALVPNAANAAAERTYAEFVPSTRYQTCNDIALVASGQWCGVPSDSVFERELSGTPDGAFVNRLRGTGGNVVTATKAKGTVTQTLTIVLDQQVPAIDLTFSYQIDELAATGAGFCGVIMSANGGCTHAGGNAMFTATPPPAGHLCADGTDSTAGYPFGYTYFGTRYAGANTPGNYTGGFYLQCHASAIASGTTITLSFATNTQISPSGDANTAIVSGRLKQVTLLG